MHYLLVNTCQKGRASLTRKLADEALAERSASNDFFKRSIVGLMSSRPSSAPLGGEPGDKVLRT
jgi:hypothetical protein